MRLKCCPKIYALIKGFGYIYKERLMVIKTYFDKNNVLIKNSTTNTGRNPVAELFYGGTADENQYSRLLFYFDETRLKSLYTGGTFTDLTKLTHTLRLKNTATFDIDLLNKQFNTKDRANSFDLILFEIQQPWDEGVGYDYTNCNVLLSECGVSINPSNWIYPQTGVDWSGGTGVYSGSPSAITITTQHFDLGNEDVEMDITSYVNGLLTGDTNYGLGIAYTRALEQTDTSCLQYVGFFTRHTQTIYEPYVDTVYSNHIRDDRNNFFMDKPNKLYLYVNLGGTPTNLDSTPSVQILDNAGDFFSGFASTAVTHVTKGVYSIDITVPTSTAHTDSTLFTDIWSGVTINGIVRPNIELNFALKDSMEYYNIGNQDTLPKRIGLSVSGIQNKEKIKRGDIKKVIVSVRIPYTVEQTQLVDNLQYRIYTTEGKNELTIIDYQPIEMANNYYYFLLDTDSLLPSTYYLDVKAESNLEVTTLKNALSFDIVSESNLRKSQ